MRLWRISIQMVGASTIALCLWGFLWLIDGIRKARVVQIHEAPYIQQVLLIMNVIDVILLSGMAFAAVGLMRVSHRAAVVYTWLYVILLVYAFAPGILWGNGPLGMSIAAASGIGDLGISPLISFPIPFAYGVLSVLLVNLAIAKVTSNAGFTFLD